MNRELASMTVKEAKGLLADYRSARAAVEARLVRKRVDSPKLRIAIDTARTDHKRSLAERRYAEHQDEIARLEKELNECEIAVTGAEENLRDVRAQEPRRRSIRKRQMELGRLLDTEVEAIYRDSDSLMKRIENARRLGGELAALSPVKQESWFPFSDGKFRETVASWLWMRFSSLGGILQFPSSGKRPDLKQDLGGWRVYLDPDESDKDDVANGDAA